MTNSQYMTAAHAVTRAARAFDAELAASEPYSTTLGREMSRLRAAYIAATTNTRPASFAHAPKGTTAAWIEGTRPVVGQRLQVTRKNGHTTRFYVRQVISTRVHHIDNNGRRIYSRTMSRAVVTKTLPGVRAQ